MSTYSLRKATLCCGLTRTDAAEDALKTIFILVGRCEPATTSALAQHLGVQSPTVSVMLRKLASRGLVQRGADHTATLTAHGAEHARAVIRRHRLLETFLARVLDVPCDEVHAEAEVLEHAVSERLLARIDEHLGHPETGPHGDPIPPAGGIGGHVERWGERLDGVGHGAVFRIERIDDRDSAALRHLAGIGVRPGRTVEVFERAPFGGPLWVRVDGYDHALGDRLTTLIYGGTRSSTTTQGAHR